MPKIKQEVLQEQSKRDEYMERTRELLSDAEWDGNVSQWKKVSEVLVSATNEVGGVKEKGVSNPCVIGQEEHVRSLMTRVKEAVNKSNECVSRLNARHGERTIDTRCYAKDFVCKFGGEGQIC